jgi:hypothetical protein
LMSADDRSTRAKARGRCRPAAPRPPTS